MLETWLSKERLLSNSTPRLLTDYEESREQPSSEENSVLQSTVSSSLELHQNESPAVQRHAGQTAVLQALTLGHLGSNVYSTTEIFVDNFLLSIMSTNRFSLKVNSLLCSRNQSEMI